MEHHPRPDPRIGSDEVLNRTAFWMPVIAVWLVLITAAVTLALCLAIWNLIEAF